MRRRIRRVIYGWSVGPHRYALSRIPPDQPQVPQLIYLNIADAEAYAAETRSEIIWSGDAAIERERLRANDHPSAHVGGV